MRTRRLQSSSDPVPRVAKFSGTDTTENGHRPKAATEPLGHKTVLLHEAIERLAIQPADTVVDATLGGGGHARAIAGMLGKQGMLVGIDADASAVLRAREALKHIAAPKIHLVAANFRNISGELGKLGITQIDKALFDLGWSGYQLDAGRGFSFQKDEPLLMTYSKHPGPDELTAGKIVNEWGEESIADILFGWGEERYSRRIARMIVERRARNPFETSRELGEAIKQAVPPVYRYGRIHPATRTFQALRIAVNDELGALKIALQDTWRHLAPHGRIAVITFHSVEDREVKRFMTNLEDVHQGKRVERKPVIPSKEEISANPRARSAKLRVIQKSPDVPGSKRKNLSTQQ